MEQSKEKSLGELRQTALTLHFAATTLLINIEEAENTTRAKLGQLNCDDAHNNFIVLSAMKDRLRQMYGEKYK